MGIACPDGGKRDRPCRPFAKLSFTYRVRSVGPADRQASGDHDNQGRDHRVPSYRVSDGAGDGAAGRAFRMVPMSGCGLCGQPIPTNSHPGAPRQYCSASHRNTAASRRRFARTDVRDEHYRTRYGITVVDYDRMDDEQGHSCAICGGPPNRGQTRFDVDHDHVTGKVRGLLCRACNLTLVDVERMEAVLRYLRERG